MLQLGLTGGEMNAEASSEIERQRLGTERDKEGRRHTINTQEEERCWGKSLGPRCRGSTPGLRPQLRVRPR